MELSWPVLLGIAVGLALDAFAVAVAAGMTIDHITPRHVFRLGFHFGLFQFIMPIIGWLAGMQLEASIGRFDHWIAFGLLWYVGVKMIWESRHEIQAGNRSDPTRGLKLVTLSLATSMDALAVGLSMALLGVSIWLPSFVIGLVAAILTVVGITFGNRIGLRLGRWGEVCGGLVLLIIGLNVLLNG